MTASRLIWARIFTSNVFEDWSNRLNHCWTFYLLLLLSAAAGLWKHQFSRISCWVPAHFTPALVDYTHEQCWEASNINVFRLLDRSSVDPSSEIDQSLPQFLVYPGLTSSYDDLTYYQYVPLMLVMQALLFKLPHVIWLVFHGYSGVNIYKIYGLAAATPRCTWADHRTTATVVARYINTWLKSNLCSCIPWRVLTAVAGVVKLLYVINSITQLAVIDSFLLPGNRSNVGSHVIDGLTRTNGSYWLQSPRFPRSVLCDFKIRTIQNVQRYNVQCILPINHLHEQFYLFIWVWLLFVVNVTLFNLIFWIIKTIFPLFKTRYVMNFLSMSEEIEQHGIHNCDVSEFANYLGEDGVMVLKAISDFSSELMVRDVVADLWKMSRAADVTPTPLFRQLQPTATQLLSRDPAPHPHPQEQRSFSGGQHIYPELYSGSESEAKPPEDIPLMVYQDPAMSKFK